MEHFTPPSPHAQRRQRIAYAQELRQKFERGYLAELQPLHNWVVWKSATSNGKPTKPPYTPRTGRLASPTQPATWNALPDALIALERGDYQGIGLALPPEGWLTAIDIDETVGHNGTIYYPGKALLMLCKSYAEYSPTDGLHILVKAKLPRAVKTKQVELYARDRYVTVTLRHIRETPTTIERRQDEVERLLHHLFQKRSSTVPTAAQRPPVHVGERGTERPRLSDIQVIEKALRGPRGELFGRLLRGDTSLWEGTNARYPSQSEAELAFLGELAWWTYQNPGQMERIYQRSGLYREKWHERRGTQTYGQLTISKALNERR